MALVVVHLIWHSEGRKRTNKSMAENLKEDRPIILDGLTIKVQTAPGTGIEIWKEAYIINVGETPWWEIAHCKERNKVRRRQWMRLWYKTHPGYYNGDNHGHNKENMKRFRERNPGNHNETIREFRKTPKGRASLARMKAKRREYSTDPEVYAVRVETLHTLHESCARCGIPYKFTHQVDHILALCLGGIDDWDNFQPLCILCHKGKTAEDMHSFNTQQKARKL